MRKEKQNLPLLWRIMRKMNWRVTSNYHRGFKGRKVVLLLTTVGRKTGLTRVTPLQYEEVDGKYYVGSGRGEQADWYRNILANPQVEVEVMDRRFSALAEVVVEPQRVADFLALRLQRHPVMIGLLVRLEGLPLFYKRADLELFAARKTLVILHPKAPALDLS